ncbi:hypothetical protein [Micromonospora violae]|uniref:hypothetical protein n=1 Tax=Micromonospora violae TaxID=1278207 RepID=UPI00340B7F69
MSKEDVGVLGFALTLAVAAWNLWKFRQEGGRVHVVMKPGIFDGTSVATMESLSHKLTPYNFQANALRFNVEVMLIEIENRGRTSVTIRDVGLDLGRVHWWSLGRQTVSPPFIKFNDCEIERKVRLEPFDTVSFLINANDALWAIRNRSAGKLTIRAAARVAGRRPSRSAWRKRWRFGEGAPPRLWLDEPFDLTREIYRYLYRSASDGGPRAMLSLPRLSMTIAEWVESGRAASMEEIDRLIEHCSINEPLTTFLWSHHLASELADPKGGPFDSSFFKRRRPANAAAGKLIPLQGQLVKTEGRDVLPDQAAQAVDTSNAGKPPIRPAAPGW